MKDVVGGIDGNQPQHLVAGDKPQIVTTRYTARTPARTRAPSPAAAAEEQGIQLSRCPLAGHGLAIGSGRAVRREANARQEASRTTPGGRCGERDATPVRELLHEPRVLHTSSLPGTRPHRVACCPTGDAAVPCGSIADATPGSIDSSGALREALPLRARPTTTRPGQPRLHISRPAGGGGCARRSLPPRGSRGVEDRERRGLARMPFSSARVSCMSSLQPSRPHHRGTSAGPTVLAGPHPLVDLAEGRLVDGHALRALTSHG
jgi:hypothetical protein